jgi:hypothetical protein
MSTREVVAGLILLLLPTSSRGEGLAIDHPAVGCVVAGKHPRLTACFAPASQLARGRVYFRVAGGAPDWYYVEMRSDAPCHAGVLPRPKKELVGRQIEYYVDALDRSFAQSRSPEARVQVVGSAAECASKLPVAPILDGAAVAVFPGLPAGFAGAAAGLGAGATAAAVVGGAAIVGGGVAVAAGSSSESGGGGGGPTTTVPTPTTTLPPVTTTTTTTLPTPGFNAVFKVLQNGTLVEGDSISGTEPLKLVFDMCASTGPLLLRYAVEVDGLQTTAGCYSTIVFTTSSASPAKDAVRSSGSRTYAVTMWVRSESANNNPKSSRSLTVLVNPATSGGCAGDKTGPVVSLTSPAAGSVYPSPAKYPVVFEASASDSTTGNNGIAFVEYKVNYGKPGQKILGPITSGSPWTLTWTESEVNGYLGTSCTASLEVQAYAADTCGNASFSAKVPITVKNTGTCTPDAGPGGSAAGATIVSELGVPAGVGQVVVNGEATFPRAGRTPLAVRPVAGENRLEATLVAARAGGTWRFELGAIPGLRAETLRVVAGDVVQLGADAVTFRLAGRPGERVVLAFQAAP